MRHLLNVFRCYAKTKSAGIYDTQSKIYSHILPSKPKGKEIDAFIDKSLQQARTVNRMNSSFPDRWPSYMSDPPQGEKSHGISGDLMVLRRGMPNPRFFKKVDFFFEFTVHLVYFGTLRTIIITCTSIEWMASGSIIDK